MGCVNSCKRASGRPRLGRPRKRDGYRAISHNDTLCKLHDDYNSYQNPNTTTIPSTPAPIIIEEEEEEEEDQNKHSKESNGILMPADFSRELLQASDWSTSTAGRKTPLVPKTPPSEEEPEVIDARELMKGLEDQDDDDDENHDDDNKTHCSPPGPLQPKQEQTSSASSPKPIWIQMSVNDSVPSTQFDPEIIHHFRRALEHLGPPDISHLRSLENRPVESTWLARSATVKERVRAFQERIDRGSRKIFFNHPQVVVYYTSLRGVRKTYEDCCDVRVILRGFGVKVDEKDISMDHSFRDELHELLGGDALVGGLPKVFVKERYVGGVEEVKHMHECGELDKLLEGCERVEEGSFRMASACEGCGDVRFVVCSRCNGRSKLYEDDEELFENCPDCNEHGLVRCPVCCI